MKFSSLSYLFEGHSLFLVFRLHSHEVSPKILHNQRRCFSTPAIPLLNITPFFCDLSVYYIGAFVQSIVVEYNIIQNHETKRQ